MISIDEILNGREKESPLTDEMKVNISRLLTAVNKLREAWGMPLKVNSGYRPGHYNTDAHGAHDSPHLTCEAVDFADTSGELKKWCLANLDKLRAWGLYMEDPAHTTTWLHVQIRRPKSGNTVFMP